MRRSLASEEMCLRIAAYSYAAKAGEKDILGLYWDNGKENGNYRGVI